MLDHPVWRGVRARRELLIGQLREVIGQRPGQRLLDVAAGPGSYLFELPRGAAEYYAADIDRRRARPRAGPGGGRGPRRHLVRGRRRLRSQRRGRCPRFDILVASGFFDLLVDIADVRRLLAAGASATEPGAHWVLSVMEGHTDLKLLHDVLVDWDRKPWTAVTRSADEVIAEAEPLGWRAVKVEHEPLGLFGVVTLERTSGGTAR